MGNSNYKKIITKGYQSSIESTPVENDTLRITVDTGQLFADLNDERIEISDFIKGMTEEEITAIVAPLPKFYLSSDTNKLLIYDSNSNEWVVCAERNSDTVAKAFNADIATYAEKALNDGNGSQINTTYAPLNSPIFTGIPSVPTPETGSDNSQVANTEFVVRAIASALSNIGDIGIKIEKVDSIENLPETGTAGTIYFVPNNESGEINLYDEYMWINESYELIGSTTIDLSGYFNSIEVSGTGNAITDVTEEDGKLVYTKGASFLTEHPSTISFVPTFTESSSPNAGATIKILRSVDYDDYGHIAKFIECDVKLPNHVGTAGFADNASTADYAKKALDDGDGNNIANTYLKKSGGIVDTDASLTFPGSDNTKVRVGEGRTYYIGKEGNWAAGQVFRDTTDTTSLGAIAAKGTGDTIEFYYMGTSDDPKLKVTPDGKAEAKEIGITDKVSLSYNSTTNSLDFNFL